MKAERFSNHYYEAMPLWARLARFDLGTRPANTALQRVSKLTRWSVVAIRRQTFLRPKATWPRRWAVCTAPLKVGSFGDLAFEDLPWLQVWRSCLRKDMA